MTRYLSALKLVFYFWTFTRTTQSAPKNHDISPVHPSFNDVTDSVSDWHHDDVVHTSEKRVLVTGGAGFIGYHVARVLVSNQPHHQHHHHHHHHHHPAHHDEHQKQQQQNRPQLGNQEGIRKGLRTRVVVIDNFNDFYDVNLKRDRAYELSRLGVEVYRVDLCNGTFLKELMTHHNLSHVIHLAAQASVRFSLNNPHSYVTANIQCYLVLLETLKLFPKTKLIYASSSSVYSESRDTISDQFKDPIKSEDQPRKFHLTSDTEHPSNMYAATKRTTEVLSDVYCQTSGLRTIGLRFFTVYGPWGRPDMAVYKFAQSVSTRKELPMFTARNNSTLSRDFTYIDDVTAAVLSAMDYEPGGCGERFNVGYGHPVSLSRLVEIIETELGKNANIKHVRLPPTERLQTWADIEDTKRVLNFQPKINLEEGVKRFIQWFKQYNSTASAERDKDKILWFSKL